MGAEQITIDYAPLPPLPPHITDAATRTVITRARNPRDAHHLLTMLGIPIPIEDVYDRAGIPTRTARTILATLPPEDPGEVAQRRADLTTTRRRTA